MLIKVTCIYGSQWYLLEIEKSQRFHCSYSMTITIIKMFMLSGYRGGNLEGCNKRKKEDTKKMLSFNMDEDEEEEEEGGGETKDPSDCMLL